MAAELQNMAASPCGRLHRCKILRVPFDNGAVLVAEEWKSQGDKYIPDHETVYLHLIGGPEAPRGQYGIRKWETHDRFNRFPDSETAIVEFLKAVQK